MPPPLRDDQLYLGDDGRCFCGRLHHAGMTAHFTGYDLSGQRVHLVSEADQQEAERMRVTLACESCAAEARRRLGCTEGPMNQAAHAILSARVELLLTELREALAKREADRASWADLGCLSRVSEGLAALIQAARGS